jgi:hypothetical protein
LDSLVRNETLILSTMEVWHELSAVDLYQQPYDAHRLSVKKDGQMQKTSRNENVYLCDENRCAF